MVLRSETKQKRSNQLNRCLPPSRSRAERHGSRCSGPKHFGKSHRNGKAAWTIFSFLLSRALVASRGGLRHQEKLISMRTFTTQRMQRIIRHQYDSLGTGASLLVTGASLVVTSALLVVTIRIYLELQLLAKDSRLKSGHNCRWRSHNDQDRKTPPPNPSVQRYSAIVCYSAPTDVLTCSDRRAVLSGESRPVRGASSNKMMSGFRIITRAMETRCICPPLREIPPLRSLVKSRS